MAGTSDPRFVVVLGPARSGTTLLRDLIASNPAVAAVPFDVSHIWRSGNETRDDDAFPAEAANAETARRIRKRLTTLARREVASSDWPSIRFIAEKTVGNALRPDFVDKVLPGAVYVRIRRNPAETIQSTIAAWKAPPDVGHLSRKLRSFGLSDLSYAGWYAVNALGGRFGHGRGLKVWGARYRGIQDDLAKLDLETVCARQWLAAVGSIDRFFESLPEARRISTTYEDLVADPEALATIWSRLGIARPDLAKAVHADRVVRSERGAGNLPAAIGEDARRAVEARMIEYGYA